MQLRTGVRRYREREKYASEATGDRCQEREEERTNGTETTENEISGLLVEVFTTNTTLTP